MKMLIHICNQVQDTLIEMQISVAIGQLRFLGFQKYIEVKMLQEGQEPDTFQQSATLRRSRRCRTDKARPVRWSS